MIFELLPLLTHFPEPFVEVSKEMYFAIVCTYVDQRVSFPLPAPDFRVIVELGVFV